MQQWKARLLIFSILGTGSRIFVLPVFPRRREPTCWRTVVFVSAAKSGCSVTHLASMPSKFNFATAGRTSLQQWNSLALTSNSLSQRLQEHHMLKRVRNLTGKQNDQEVRKFNNKVGKLVYKFEEANKVTHSYDCIFNSFLYQRRNPQVMLYEKNACTYKTFTM